MSSFIIFDLEFTSWEGALEEDWSRNGQLREIVQIGAIRVDSSQLTVLDEFDVLVRPTTNPTISTYLTGITGLTQEALDANAIEPAVAIGMFLGFCRNEPTLCYGNDMVVLGENYGWARARGESVANGFLGAYFVNVRRWINHLAPETNGINAGRLWKILNLPKPADGQEHSATFDCYSILSAIRHIHSIEGRVPESLLLN